MLATGRDFLAPYLQVTIDGKPNNACGEADEEKCMALVYDREKKMYQCVGGRIVITLNESAPDWAKGYYQELRKQEKEGILGEMRLIGQ